MIEEFRRSTLFRAIAFLARVALSLASGIALLPFFLLPAIETTIQPEFPARPIHALIRMPLVIIIYMLVGISWVANVETWMKSSKPRYSYLLNLLLLSFALSFEAIDVAPFFWKLTAIYAGIYLAFSSKTRRGLYSALSSTATPEATETHTTIVIAVDLSRSVDVRGPDGKTEFQKNIEAVAKQLAQVPAGSRITIIGITDHSFIQPLILLSATIPADAGSFGERLSAARDELVRRWQTRKATLVPRFGQTDIIGAMMLAGQLWRTPVSSYRRLLVIYSDMRQSTFDLNLEASPSGHNAYDTIRKQDTSSLSGVEVEIVGVDGAGRSMNYWRDLRRFWVDYLNACGAKLTQYSPIRDAKSLQ